MLSLLGVLRSHENLKTRIARIGLIARMNSCKETIQIRPIRSIRMIRVPWFS